MLDAMDVLTVVFYGTQIVIAIVAVFVTLYINKK